MTLGRFGSGNTDFRCAGTAGGGGVSVAVLPPGCNSFDISSAMEGSRKGLQQS